MFGCALQPRSLFGLRELLVSNKVIPALAPHVDVLAAVTGTTLDLLHVVVRGRLGLLVCRTASAAVVGITGPWSRPGEPTGEEAPARGGVGTLPSPAGGVGTLSSPSTMLLGGGALVASSSLVGLLAAVLAEAGSSSALSATVAAAGCSVVCSAVSTAASADSATL